MTDLAFIEQANRFLGWLIQRALPYWSTVGLDTRHGGFVEQIGSDCAMSDLPRRARLTARQIYVFATAERLGWSGHGRRVAHHGLDWLFKNHVKDHEIISEVDRTGRHLRTEFDLYDHAFVIFALAAAASIDQTNELEERAIAILERMKARWAHPLGGFREAPPNGKPLQSNAHMHLFEASLAWMRQSGDLAWTTLADELAELCLTRFFDPRSGAVREFFDDRWRPLDEPMLDRVEPGHQAEWAWLLIKWATMRGRPDAINAARSLFHLAERHGRSTQGLFVNELGPALESRDPLMRLWPQTERLKLLLAMTHLPGEEHVKPAGKALCGAVRNVRLFFEHPIQGAWWEHIGPDSKPLLEMTRASSLYHIVGAAEELVSLFPELKNSSTDARAATRL